MDQRAHDADSAVSYAVQTQKQLSACYRLRSRWVGFRQDALGYRFIAYILVLCRSLLTVLPVDATALPAEQAAASSPAEIPQECLPDKL